jgi:hypothetical protein
MARCIQVCYSDCNALGLSKVSLAEVQERSLLLTRIILDFIVMLEYHFDMCLCPLTLSFGVFSLLGSTFDDGTMKFNL